MKNSLLPLSLALASVVALHAEAPTDMKEKRSYSIGVNMAQSLKQSGLDVDPKSVAAGLTDALSGGKLQMTDEEMKSTLQGLQAEMQAKMQEKAAAAEAKAKTDAPKNQKASDDFLAANKKKDGIQTTASGLQYKIITAGKGDKPKASDTVVVNYAGTLIDGTEFDSSYKRGEPASFPVNQVIPGWTEALQLMPVGSKWQLFIPPALAYGENAPPEIGANQALIFTVELISIKK